MGVYELSLIVKMMSKAKLITTVKRTAEMIMSNKGYIEKIQFLGTRQLPYRMTTHGQSQNKGSYFLIHYHAPYESFESIKDFCKRDLDVVRPLISDILPKKEYSCTLSDEIKPPAYRLEVAKMTKEAEQRLPINLRIRKKTEDQLKNYKF